jgi:hypothetical protein
LGLRNVAGNLAVSTRAGASGAYFWHVLLLLGAWPSFLAIDKPAHSRDDDLESEEDPLLRLVRQRLRKAEHGRSSSLFCAGGPPFDGGVSIWTMTAPTAASSQVQVALMATWLSPPGRIAVTGTAASQEPHRKAPYPKARVE